MQWYYAQDGESKGPVSEEDLRRLAADGVLKPTDYIWSSAMRDRWAPASSLPGLFDGCPAGRPPAVSFAHPTGPLSCSSAVRPAWQRMKHILFRPVGPAKWFVLGLSAWLAALGEGAGQPFLGNLNRLRKRSDGNAPGPIDFHEMLSPVREAMSRSGSRELAIGIVVVALAIGLALLGAWLRARGKFMFLDNVVNNRAEASAPWREFEQHGNSLFRWYILYGMARFFVAAILAGVTILAVVLPCLRAGTVVRSAIPPAALIGALWLLFTSVTAYIGRFVEDFVVPIAYRYDLTIMESWGRFRTLLKPHFGAFVVYGLFYLLLSVVAGLCVLAFVLATCCVGGCFMVIPYIGAVVLLPVSVFFRAYSLEFLAGFGRDYRLFSE